MVYHWRGLCCLSTLVMLQCISSDLSWSNHITSIGAKAKRILGSLYRQYYNHVEGDVLKLLCSSLVRTHLEYSCAVWNPYTLKDKRNIEQVQKFACKVASKHWDAGYEDLLELVGLPPLEQRRIYLKLCLIFMACVISPLGFLLPGKFLTT